MKYPAIVLHKGKEVSVQRKHPWIFSGAIKSVEAGVGDGDIVEVSSSRGDFLCMAYYGSAGIAARIISYQQEEIGEKFWIDKLTKAFEYRTLLQAGMGDTNVFRLFFGEGDGVPGLILDYYDGHVVMQAHTKGVYMQREIIFSALGKVAGLNLKSFYDKSAESLPGKKEATGTNEFLLGSEEELIVRENSHQFRVDFIRGQKTGFFIDQRDNRYLLAGYSHDRVVLNAFSYTGGFSVYAAKGGATRVDSVDASAPALAICAENMKLNGFDGHQEYNADVFEFLKDKKDVYDLIVLDPPAFAKSRDSRHNAVIAYKRLNALAMKTIRDHGIIFTFSCSGVVDKQLFYNTITAAALESGREVKILRYLTQSPDHPVIPFFPEGEYLKGMVLYIGKRANS